MSIQRTCHPCYPSTPTFSLCLSLSLSLAFCHTHTHTCTHSHTQTISYKNIFPLSNIQGLLAATQFSSVGGRSEEQSALYLLYWQTSLKSTVCISPVKVSAPHKYRPITPEGEGQQYNIHFLPMTEPLTLSSSQRHKCLLHQLRCPKKPQSQAQERRRDSSVTVQWQGWWKDGEVTGRTLPHTAWVIRT